MDGANLTFRVFGKTCVVALPAVDGVSGPSGLARACRPAIDTQAPLPCLARRPQTASHEARMRGLLVVISAALALCVCPPSPSSGSKGVEPVANAHLARNPFVRIRMEPTSTPRSSASRIRARAYRSPAPGEPPPDTPIWSTHTHSAVAASRS